MSTSRPHVSRKKVPAEFRLNVNPPPKNITVAQVQGMSRNELVSLDFSELSVEFRDAKTKRLHALRQTRLRTRKRLERFRQQSQISESVDELYQRSQNLLLEVEKQQENLNREYQTLAFYQDKPDDDEFQDHSFRIEMSELRIKMTLCQANIYFTQWNIETGSAEALKKELEQAAIEQILRPFQQNLDQLKEEKGKLEEEERALLVARGLLEQQRQRFRQEEERRLSLLELPIPNTQSHDRATREAYARIDSAAKMLPQFSFLSQPRVAAGQFKPMGKIDPLGPVKRFDRR